MRSLPDDPSVLVSRYGKAAGHAPHGEGSLRSAGMEPSMPDQEATKLLAEGDRMTGVETVGGLLYVEGIDLTRSHRNRPNGKLD